MREFTKMYKLRIVLGCVLPLSVLCACGESEEPAGPFAETLGDTPYGTPLPVASSDTSILADQKNYRPASYTSSGGVNTSGGTTESSGGAGASADAQTAGRELVTDLLNFMEDGEISYILDLFVADQVSLLRDDDEFLYNSWRAYDELSNELATAAGDSALAQLNGDLRKLALENLVVEPQGTDSATLSPNPLVIFLGPELATPTLTITRTEDGWKIQLPNPLTEDDVEKMREYHLDLLDRIYMIADAVSNGTISTREDVQASLLKVAKGEDPGLSKSDEGKSNDAGNDEGNQEGNPDEGNTEGPGGTP